MVASNLLPLLFLSLLAGVVADMFGKAKVVLWAQVTMGSAAAAMAIATQLGVITPGLLLGLGLLLGIGLAFNLPAWQSLVPELVPRGMVASAVALNSAAFNVARAVGPALGGILIATVGPAAAFALNALSYAGVIVVVAALVGELGEEPETGSIGAITNSIGLSIRYARYTAAFRRVLGLLALFGLFTAVIQATLPNRTDELGGDEATYGLLLGAMGVGALLAAFARTRIPSLASGAALPFTIGMFGLAGIGAGVASSTPLALLAMVVVGASWVLTLTVLNAITQLMTPHWVRGRAMSLYLLSFNGILPVGSILSGALADRIGAGPAMVWLSAGTLALGLAVPLFRIPRLDQIESPEYELERRARPHAETEGGPVMVVNTWHIRAPDLPEFLQIMQEVRIIRLRTGAYAWELYRNSEDPHRLSEVFMCVSWEEHLAQHRRTDDASLEVLRTARQMDASQHPTSVHLIAVDVERPADWESLRAAHEEFHRSDGTVPLVDVHEPEGR